MKLTTVKETETSKISFLKTDGKATKVHKEFFKENSLDKELLLISLLDSSLKPEIRGNTLIYPYLTPLSDHLNRPIPEPEALMLIEQCIEILEELKTKNIVHRDIKPGNLYLNSNKRLFISDFESAIMNFNEDLGRTCGTPGYMAPEQYQTPNVNWLADQYSMGAVIFKILTGYEAFDENSRTFKSQSSTNPDPSIANPKLKVPFCKIVQKLMNPDKDKRFQSFDDIKSAVDECSQSLIRPEILEDEIIKISPRKTPTKKATNKSTYILLLIVLILASILLKTL